jgi:hypothetical protein
MSGVAALAVLTGSWPVALLSASVVSVAYLPPLAWWSLGDFPDGGIPTN